MINPIKAISAKTMMSNPYAINPHKAYGNIVNYAFKGEKLNINCNDMRSVTKQGKKLDILA